MVSINNSNNSRSYRSSGILGLSTGIDSESVIEGMLAKTQTKIDKQLGLKQQTLWKQEIYRDVISNIQNLQRKYFDNLNPKTNLLSKSFFSSQTVTSSSDSVIASSNQSRSSELTIDYIKQLATGSQIISQNSVTSSIKLTIDPSKITSDSSINVSLDGVTRAIQLSGTSTEEVLSNLQETLNKSFGTGVVVQADGTITTLSSRQITFSGTTENLSILGLSASASNRVNLSSQLKDLKLNQSLNNTSFKFKINGVEFNFDETKTVSEVIDTINQSKANVSLSYSNINDRFVLSSKILGQGVDIDMEDLSGNLMGSLFKVSSDEFNRIEGKNAILSVDGQEIERNSNNFEVNQFKLNLVSTNTNKTVLSAKNSTNEVSSTITKFVEEYNSLVDKIYSLTTEKSEYRDYSPLTDAQKEEMSEKEIELWEKKAKTGLVRSDTNLVSLMSELRQSLMSKGDGSLSLNDMGITSGSYSDRGKLSIDPTKLNEALETRMDEVQALFTDVNTGLAQKFNAVLNKNAQTSLSNPGRLVSVAGIANTSSDIKNTMYDRIKSIESSITNLQRMYDSQKDRYWKQFSNLETAMSKLNSQSSWLTQQLG